MKQSHLKALFSGMLLSAALLVPLQGQPLKAQVNLPTLGDSLSGTMTIQQEYEFGREVLRSMRRSARLLNDPLIEDYIINLTYELAMHSDLRDMRLEFLLIDSNELNAFAAPGGIIGVNAGLFSFADNEGQFASVIAHEIAHISQRHYVRSIQEARNSSVPNLAAAIAGIIILATVGGDAGHAALATSQAISIDNQLRYSRSNEQEADRIGIRTLYNAGFDPQDMVGMFQNMMRARGGSTRAPEFLLTHPLTENRIADSRNRAATYPAVTHNQNIEFLLMKQRVAAHYSSNISAHAANLEENLGRQRGQAATASRYGLALAQLRSGQPDRASETLAPLLQDDPYRISYVMLDADIAKAAGDHQRAVDILRTNLRINPNNHPLTMALAQTLEDAGEFVEAANVLRAHSRQRPNDIQLWYQLAELQGLIGDISGLHQSRAEYFFATGELGRAIQQLNQALLLETNAVTTTRIQQRIDDIRRIGDRFYR